jgi:hypothetical protein
VSVPTMPADIAARVRQVFANFRTYEEAIRSQHLREEDYRERDLLERNTRRFIIDGLLQALDWDPGDPRSVVEEARSYRSDGERLYFDYLGVEPQNSLPVLLVEAKGVDAELPRRKRKGQGTSADVEELLATAINDIRTSGESKEVLSHWNDWLIDLREYVESLDALGRANLARVVITAGRWIVVLERPVATLLGPEAAIAQDIHCLDGVDEMVPPRSRLYSLLHRSWLVDTLPSTLKLVDAPRLLEANAVDQVYRGVLVSTSMVGPSLAQRPNRTIHSALILETGDRLVGVIDSSKELAEPKGNYTEFLAQLALHGADLERRLWDALGTAPRALADLSTFPGFKLPITISTSPVLPLPGSTAAKQSGSGPEKRYSRSVGGRNDAQDYLIATGSAYHYKLSGPSGEACDHHSFVHARTEASAFESPHVERDLVSFTVDLEPTHCANAMLHGRRAKRCQVVDVESNLCCRSCVFDRTCWCTETVLPCPPR